MRTTSHASLKAIAACLALFLASTNNICCALNFWNAGRSFRYAGDIRPGNQSPQRTVTDPNIIKPDYAVDGKPKAMSPDKKAGFIEVKSLYEIEKMRTVGRVAREVLDAAGRAVRPGITTDEIDSIVYDETVKRGAYPSPLNYHGFPKSCCTSVNEVICHGIPDDRHLRDGEIVNIDITCYLNGYHGDCSEMFLVGNSVDSKGKQLLQTTYDCWIKAMEIVKPGVDYREIGCIVEDYVVPRGYSTVQRFCGHGIGSTFHTNPRIYHFRTTEYQGQMAAGHTFTIEPMICEGLARTVVCCNCIADPYFWPDNWTATTVDGKRSAQFEHTLLVTPDGVEALTGKIETSPLQFWEKESFIHQGYWLGTTPTARRKAADLLANGQRVE